MNLKNKIRVEFYIPFAPIPEYDILISILIKLFSKFFEGCTIIDKIDGYYQPFGSKEIWPDIVNIFVVDVPLNSLQDYKKVEELCEAVTNFVNKKLKQAVIYFSIEGRLFPQ